MFKRKSGLNYCLATVLAGVLALQAGPVLAESLVDAMATAYSTNPDLATERARLRQTDETVSQAVANWRPKVTVQVQGGKEYLDSYPLRRYQHMTPRSAAITAVQPLFRGFQTVSETRATNSDVMAERQTLVAQEQAILAAATQAYMDVVRDEAVVKLQASNVNVLQEQLTATNARFKVGELTRTDVSQAEARLAGSKAELARSQSDLATSRAAYQRVIGNPPGSLSDPHTMGELPKTEEEAVNVAGVANPNVKAASFRVDAARYRVSQAEGALLPTINLIGQASRGYDQSLEGDRVDSAAILGQIQIPLYQNGAEYSRVRQAKQVVGQRLSELDSARRQAVQQAIAAWRQLQATRAQLKSITAQIQANTVALEGVRQEAQVGSRTTLDVLNAEQELLNSKVDLVRAQHDQTIAYYQVLSAIGQLTARNLKLPVQFYDEEQYYKENSGKWIGLGD